MVNERSSSDTAAQPIVQVVLAIVSQAAVVTAVLYYLGWVRTDATYSYFDIDTSLLTFSIPDYVLHSVNSIVVPLIVVAVLVLVAVHTHSRFEKSQVWWRKRRTVGRVVARCGAALVVAGLLVIALATWTALGAPALCVGFASLAYGVALTETTVRRLWSVTLGLLIGVTFLWSSSLYAVHVGEVAARDLADVGNLPQLVVYSEEDLALEGSGVIEERLPASEGYRFRYEGLGLLVRSGDQIFALPSDWRPDSGVVVVLPNKTDVKAMRIEFGERT